MTYQFDPILGQGRDGAVSLAEQQAGFNRAAAAEKAAFRSSVSGVTKKQVARRLLAINPSRKISVMSSPPTITVSTTNPLSAGSAVRPSVINQTGDNTAYPPPGVALFGSDKWVQAGQSSPDLHLIRPTNITTLSTGSKSSGVACIAFTCRGADVSICLKGLGSKVLVKIDGEFTSPISTPYTVPLNSALNYLAITGMTAGRKRVEIYVSGAICYFGGVWHALTDRIMPAEQIGPTICAIGDSFWEGNTAGQGTIFDSFLFRLWQYIGVSDFIMGGLGGTGFVTKGAAGLNFVDRFDSDIGGLTRRPVVLLAGQSINDSAQSVADVLAGVQAFDAKRATQLPDCIPIYAFPTVNKGVGCLSLLQYQQHDAVAGWCAAQGIDYANDMGVALPQNWSPDTSAVSAIAGSHPAITLTVTETLQEGAVYRVGDTSVRIHVRARLSLNQFTVACKDIAQVSAGMTLTREGDGYLSGTGRVGALAGWGNADITVGNGSTDSTHPNPAGHDEKSSAMLSEWLRIINAWAA